MIRTLQRLVLAVIIVLVLTQNNVSFGQCSGVTIDMIVTSQTNVLCNGASTGEITLDATGGTAPYTFTWAAPISTSEDTISNLAAGVYYITIADALGCDTIDSVTVSEPPILDVTAGSTPATCGSADGTATAFGSGGVGPYSYTWWPIGGSSSTATGLVQGDYQVTIIDGNLCTDTYLVTVDAVGGPAITLVTSTGVSCNGSVDGQATVGAAGGSGNYTFSWNPGALSGNAQTNLAAGDYSVTVLDEAGCTDNITVTITEPAQINLTPANVNSATCGLADGDVGVFVNGGTGPYSYAWTPNIGNTQVVNNVSSGLYNVSVTDVNGCSETTNIVVPDATGPSVNVVSSTDVSCFGVNDGSATVEAIGGATPYTYQWSPTGGNNASATNLSGGNYEVLVSDANGCLGFTYLTIDEANEIIINSTVVDEDCGADNGGIFAFASGGAGGLTYLWSPGGQTSTSLVNLENGNYSLTVTDFDGCTATENYTISVIYDPNNPNNPDLSISPDTAIYLFTGEQQQISVSGALNYTWSPSAGLSCDDCPNPLVSAFAETYYTVTGYNADNCYDTAYIHILIKVPCADMFVPNSFSPNGDGLNDELRVLGSCINNYEYSVFDRWGKRIFYMDSESEIQSWNGKINGEPVMVGNYPYIFKAQFYDDSNEEFDFEEKGILKILR